MSVSQLLVTPHRIKTRLIIYVALTFVCCPWAIAQPGSSKPHFKEARKIVAALYPELSGKHLSLTYSFSVSLDSNEEPSITQFDVLVSRFPPGQKVQIAGYLNGAASDSKPKDVQMFIGLWFDNSGQLERFTAQGDPLSDNKNKAARGLVNAHSDWTDDQIRDELKVAGAKFGPGAKQDLVKEIPLDELSSILGRPKIVSAEFEFRDPQTANNAATLVWQVELETEPERGGVPKHSLMILEPFGGKITYLQRLSGK